MRIEYLEVSLAVVLEHYSDGLKAKKKTERIYDAQPFVDTAKNKVIFKVYIEEKEKSK